MARAARPRHLAKALDVAGFCAEGGRLEGEAPVRDWPRLAEAVRCGDDGFAGAAFVRWRAAGAVQARRGAAPRRAITLGIEADAVLECQRCLQPVTVPLRIERQVIFVEGEDEAARLDEELEDDVLALPARLDLPALVEDELLLALPLVPRHEPCPQLPAALVGALVPAGAEPAGSTAVAAGAEPARHRPFAGLGQLAGMKPTDPRGSDGSGGGGAS